MCTCLVDQVTLASLALLIYTDRKYTVPILSIHLYCTYTLSGHIGKVVVSHAAVACSSPADIALIYTMHEALRGYCP